MGPTITKSPCQKLRPKFLIRTVFLVNLFSDIYLLEDNSNYGKETYRHGQFTSCLYINCNDLKQ